MRGCPTCGRPGCGRHGRQRAPRRAYSGTALERRMRVDVVETYGSDCVYCHAPIDLEAPKGDDDALELAHVIAHADGGEYVLENLRPSHCLCNRQRGRAPIGGAR